MAVNLKTALVTHGLDVVEYTGSRPEPMPDLLLVRSGNLSRLPEVLTKVPMVIFGSGHDKHQALAVIESSTPLPSLAMVLTQVYARLRQQL